MCVFVPNFSQTLNLTRFYSILLPFFSPLFVLGGAYLFNLNKNIQKEMGLKIMTFIIIITFLFNIGLINHITKGYPISFSLDLDRKLTSSEPSIQIHAHSAYYLDQETRSAIWLSNVRNPNYTVYAGSDSQQSVLISHALLQKNEMSLIFNTTIFQQKSYIYFKYLNVKTGFVKSPQGLFHTSDLSHLIMDYSKIYSNDCSEIDFKP